MTHRSKEAHPRSVSERRTPPFPSSDPPPETMGPSILILEDDADVRRALTRFSDGQGFQTRGEGTVAGALEALEEEAVDLLLADIDLPDGSGLDLLKHLRKTGRWIPTILVTGLHDVALAAEGIKPGAADFLTKPLNLNELAEAIRSALDEGEEGAKPDSERKRAGEPSTRPRLVGRHPSIVELFKQIGIASFSSSPVLIRGESGVGKELVAREIHRHSRPDTPFVAVNCASVPDSLLESELFGHRRGAFTGAVSSHKGRFEIAGDGTLFLDEIGDASASFQATILRALQEGEFLPVGAERPRPVQARIIAATNRALEAGVREGSFRTDLFYRIQVLEMDIPTLRDRMSDLPELSAYFLRRSADRLGWSVPSLSPGAQEVLRSHTWPGNVRELENVLERALVNSRGGTILEEHIELLTVEKAEVGDSTIRGEAPGESKPDRLDLLIHRHAHAVLRRCGGNKREAARLLGISPGRLYRILEQPPSAGEE